MCVALFFLKYLLVRCLFTEIYYPTVLVIVQKTHETSTNIHDIAQLVIVQSKTCLKSSGTDVEIFLKSSPKKNKNGRHFCNISRRRISWAF